jgi:hypothetical protein
MADQRESFLCRLTGTFGGSMYGLVSLEHLGKRSSWVQQHYGKAATAEEWLRVITTRQAGFREHMRLLRYGRLFDQHLCL